jgi:hypothetical protein
MTPEDVLVEELLTIFPREQIGPAGTVVYHASGDPILPYVLYRRTNSHFDRDLFNNRMTEVIEFDVSIDSKFFTDVASPAMPDNWINEGWNWALEGVEADQENYRVVYTYVAARPAPPPVGGPIGSRPVNTWRPSTVVVS